MKTKVNIEIDLTPSQLAEVFVNWSDIEQAEFVNLIGKTFKQCDFDAEYQCCHIADKIDKSGRDFIYTVANFMKVRGIKCGSPKENTLINSYGPHERVG